MEIRGRKAEIFFLLITLFAEVFSLASRSSAQTHGQTTGPETVITLQVSAGDGPATGAATGHRVRTFGALRPEGGRYPSTLLVTDGSGSLVSAQSQSASAAPVFYTGPGITPPGLPVPGFYPGDMYQFTPPGPVVARAQVHNVYVNCNPDCWGDPATFEKNLFKSDFIHVVDQYVGSTEDHRYGLGASALVNYPVSAPLSDGGDIASIVYAIGAKFGTGYSHIYNIFLPKGVDVCVTLGVCYSPDSPATWGTCSYHSFFDFPDIGHVLYVVIPYQDDFAIVNGAPFYACDVGQPDPTVDTAATPNGVLGDSTSHVISHEMLETITDPDYDGWQSSFYWDFFPFEFTAPGEISDTCTNLSYLYTPFEVAGKLYYIAPAYSNKYHLCTMAPSVGDAAGDVVALSPAYFTRAAGPGDQPEITIPLQVTVADRAAAGSTISHGIHTIGAARPKGGRHAPMTFKSEGAGPLEVMGRDRAPAQIPGFTGEVYSGALGFPPGSFYPYDVNLFDFSTGAIRTLAQSTVLTRGRFHNIYINQTADHWGNPSVFQHHLFESDFIHLADQYVGSDEDERYELGTAALMNYPVSSMPLTDAGDIAAIVHAAAVEFGTGLSHVYNVFLPKGVNVCASIVLGPSSCFSPDNFATWNLCAYHGSYTFADIGTVIYTVEPYLDVFAIVNGVPSYVCDVGQAPPYSSNTAPTPNGVLVDSMSSFLSHETFETITDPVPELLLGWWSFNSDTNNEIGDICANPYFLYVPFEVFGKLYYIQPEYSNKYHACVTVP